MDNEMIAKMGRAMADYACVNYQHNQAIYDAYAKVAAKAMREPTEKMKTLVTEDMVITDKCYYCGGHIDGWRTMIDSIIND